MKLGAETESKTTETKQTYKHQVLAPLSVVVNKVPYIYRGGAATPITDRGFLGPFILCNSHSAFIRLQNTPPPFVTESSSVLLFH